MQELMSKYNQLNERKENANLDIKMYFTLDVLLKECLIVIEAQDIELSKNFLTIIEYMLDCYDI